MGQILPIDLSNIFLGEIEKSKRAPDGKLHCSSDLTQPLRFSQLRAVGAPEVPRSTVSSIRLYHGTLWHEWFARVLDSTGIEFKAEVKLDEYLPEGWSGTADWLFWHPEYEAWALGDLKTIRGEALFWIERDGAKDTHIWQLSAYWHALNRIGIPLIEGFGVMYWPMNDTNDTVDVAPKVMDCKPLPAEEVNARMEFVRERVDEYRTAWAETGEYLNDALEPMPEREQKYYWNKQQGVFDVKLVPLWYERFCDFDEELCPRSATNKIGHYTLDRRYEARQGYGDIIPTVNPTEKEYAKRSRSNG